MPTTAKIDPRECRHEKCVVRRAGSHILIMHRNLKKTQLYKKTSSYFVIQMSISIAYSGWTPYDNLYNFFLIEGDLENPLAIYRMTQFLYQNYISKGNKVTVLGLDNTFSRSSIVFVPLSQAQQYDSYTAASGYMNLNQVDIDATVGEKKKKIVTMISMRDYVMIWKMEKVRT